MPNWCTNKISITGKSNDINNFILFFQKGETFLFKRIIEKPKDFDANLVSGSPDMCYTVWFGNITGILEYPWIKKENITTRSELKKYFIKENKGNKELALKYKKNIDLTGCKTWYQWNIANWGTKWEPSGVHFHRKSDTNLIVHYDTAWNPAMPIIDKLSQMFINLKFVVHYYEPGCGFKGTYIIKNSKILKDDCKDWYPY